VAAIQLSLLHLPSHYIINSPQSPVYNGVCLTQWLQMRMVVLLSLLQNMSSNPFRMSENAQ
jgi:hypothetical protein